MNRKLIARQLILEAKRLLAAGKDESDYVYDPDHKHKPKGGHWEKTEKGWSQKKNNQHDKKKKGENVGQKEFSSLMKKLENCDYDKVDVSVFEKLNSDQLEQVLGQYDHIGDEQLNAFLKNPFFFETGVIEPEDVFGFESLPDNPKKAQNLFNKRINALIENPSTPRNILETLAKGEIERCVDSEGTYSFEGTGINIPNEIAEKARRTLQNNTGNTLSEPRRETKTFSIETLKGLGTREQENIATELDTPPDILRELGKSRSNNVRKAVAANPKTPDDTLIKLSKDKQELVRGRVAANPKTPVDTLVELGKDKDSWIRQQAQEELQKRKSIENAPIDLSKLSPELREQVKDMDPEELKKFIGWLKERKG